MKSLPLVLLKCFLTTVEQAVEHLHSELEGVEPAGHLIEGRGWWEGLLNSPVRAEAIREMAFR